MSTRECSCKNSLIYFLFFLAVGEGLGYLPFMFLYLSRTEVLFQSLRRENANFNAMP